MSIKILLADDSITIQKVIGIIFGGEEYSLTVVDNGKAALEKAREAAPDVLLIDAIMPGMSGYEVCEAIRATPELGEKPLLLLTGSFEPFDEVKARSCGADDFLAKPFESQQIIAKVREMYQLGVSRAATAAQTSAPSFEAPSFGASSFEPPPNEPQPIGPLSFEAPTFEVPASEPFSFDAPSYEPPSFEPQPSAPLSFEVPTFEVPSFDVPASEPLSFEPPPFEPPVMPEEPQAADRFIRQADPDDIWGAFTSSADPAPAVQFETDAPKAPLGPDVFDIISEEARMRIAQPVDSGSDWIPVEENTFEFEEESVAEMPPSAFSGLEAPGQEDAFGDISFTDASQAITAASPAPPEQAPVETPSAAPLAEGVPATLSEAQLKAAIAGVSQEVIERIVWEVVPDLAETLIKEAIRKIREGL